MRFIISTHKGLEGVRLSKPGHFTNLPFPTDDAAVAHARKVAGRQPVAIEREHYGPVRKIALDLRGRATQFRT